MKKLFKPACLLFNLLMLLTFFILGLAFAGWIEAGKGQMLAGGAIVLGYGVLFGGIAFIASFFITYRAQHKLLVISNSILLLILLSAIGYFRYRYTDKKQNSDNETKVKKTLTVPAKTYMG